MSEDAPNPAAAPPAPLIPEGVKCVGCDYDLRGLTVDSVCPECGKPIGETVIANLDELRDSEWVVKVLRLTSDTITVNFIAALTMFGCIFGLFMLAGAAINTALLVRALRFGPDGHQQLIPRWPETLCWGSLPFTAVGVILFLNGNERGSLSFISAAFLLELIGFAVVVVDAVRAIQACKHVVMPKRFVLRIRFLLAGYMMVLSWVATASYVSDDVCSHPLSIAVIVIGALFATIFSILQHIEIDVMRKKLAKIIDSSCAYHDKIPRSIAHRIGRQLWGWRTGR